MIPNIYLTFQLAFCGQGEIINFYVIILTLTFRESQARELTNLRSRNIELEAEVDSLRRKLTNERFER